MTIEAQWEYKTILQPSIDEWLVTDQRLALDAAMGKSHDKIIEKHCAFLNKTLGVLGQEGWELVAMWKSDPTQFFKYSAAWLTFKRRIA